MDHLYRSRTARAIALLAAAYSFAYVGWRITATLNPEALLFSVLLLAAEVHGVVNFLLFVFMVWDTDRAMPFQHRPGLRVDVYVPTYDESLDILEATLTGCGGIAYPHVTYVLDDGRRPEVRALAERLGCRYLTRPDNRHGKAGNLNAALPRTGGDFIAVLDADMVPQPDFLDRTLGYFVDEQVALVQLPQEFYNLDSVQHAGTATQTWHEQSLFYRVIQPGKNRWNAAFWCGSPSVIRRAALEDIGGVATGTLTEDLHTSIRLHARGWKTVYHDEPLAFGIAPQTLYAFTLQRLRWANGTMQILRSRENPLIKGGLTLAQRLNYLASMSTYFEAYQQLIYLLTPSVILLTGLLPIRVSGADFLARWVPYFLLGLAAQVALGRGHLRYVRQQEYNLLKVLPFLWATTTLVWPRRLRFLVTPKQFTGGDHTADRRLIMPLGAVIAVIAATAALGLANILWGITVSYAHYDLVLMATIWAAASAALLAAGIWGVVRRLYQRRSYRFPVRVPADVWLPGPAAVHAATVDLSQDGAGLVVSRTVGRGQWLSVTVHLPDGPLTLDGKVAYSAPTADGACRLGVEWLPMTPVQRQRLFTFLFVTVPRHSVEGISLPEAPVPHARTA